MRKNGERSASFRKVSDGEPPTQARERILPQCPRTSCLHMYTTVRTLPLKLGEATVLWVDHVVCVSPTSPSSRSLGLPDPAGLNQKMQWLQAVGVLECLARRLPEGALNESVLSVEDKDGWSKLFQGLQEEILGLVMDGQEDIKRSAVASMRVDSMNSKFSSVGDCKVGVYGTLEDFAKGLDAAVGLPNVNVWETMKREHCSGPDHSEIFETHYNREETTSELEWQCVADAEQGKTYPGDRKDAPPLDFFLKMAVSRPRTARHARCPLLHTNRVNQTILRSD